jgi:hypothetical protein
MENISLRYATPQDADFLFQLYAATRQEEMAQTGWDTAQIEAFLHMQYTTRNRQYETQFPSAQN